MIGMSVSEVVGPILGVLIALAVSYAVLVPSKTESADRLPPRDRLWLSTVFVWSCFFSMMGGVYARTHSLLSPKEVEVLDSYQLSAFFGTEERPVDELSPLEFEDSENWLRLYSTYVPNPPGDGLIQLLEHADSEDTRMRIIQAFWSATQSERKGE